MIVVLLFALLPLLSSARSPCGTLSSQESFLLAQNGVVNGSLTIPAGVYTPRVLPLVLADGAQLTVDAGAVFLGSCADSSLTAPHAFLVAASASASVTGGVFRDFVVSSPMVVSKNASFSLSSAHFSDNIIDLSGFTRSSASEQWSLLGPATTSAGAGVLSVLSGATATLDTIEIARCGSAGAGVAHLETWASLHTTNVNITDCAGGIAGIAVQDPSSFMVAANLVVDGAVGVSSSSSDDDADNTVGGFLVGHGASLVLESSQLRRCSGSWGGAVATSVGATGTVAVTNIIFEGNHVTGDKGGAIHAGQRTTVTVAASSFANNVADTSGGAIGLSQRAILAMGPGCVFNGNRARLEGGDLSLADRSHAAIQGPVLFTNSSAPIGGVFVVHAHASLNISIDVTIESPSALYGGTGLVDGHGSVALSDLSLSGGVALRAGAVLGRDFATLTVRDSVVQGSRVNMRGGAFALADQATLVLDRVIATDNWAARGGVVYAGEMSEVTLLDCSVSGNVAMWGGGAVASTDYTRVTLLGGTYSNNAVVRGGGGVIEAVDRAVVNMIGGNYTRNYAPKGGVTNLDGCVDMTQINGSFTYNEATTGDARPSGEGGVNHVETRIFENDANLRVPSPMHYSYKFSNHVFALLNATLFTRVTTHNDTAQTLYASGDAASNLMVRLEEQPVELVVMSTRSNDYKFNLADYGAVHYMVDTSISEGHILYLQNHANVHGGATYLYWWHFREDDPVFQESPWAFHHALGHNKVIGNSAGQKGGAQYWKMNKTPARTRWSQSDANTADGSGNIVTNNTANIGGYLYFADVKIDEINEVFTVFALQQSLADSGIGQNTGRTYGDLWGSDKFKLFLRWDLLGTQPAPIALNSGQLLEVPHIIEMVDMTHTRTVTNFDLVELSIGACISRSDPLTLSTTSAVELETDTVKFNLANGVADWPVMRVYGDTGDYCVYVSPAATDNIVYRITLQVRIDACSGIEVADGVSSSNYLRCMQELFMPRALQIAYTSSGALLLVALLVTVLLILWRRNSNIVQVTGLATLLVVALGMAIGLIVPMLWNPAASTATCLLFMWSAHICFVLVITPIVVKLLHLKSSESVNNVSLHVPTRDTLVPTTIALIFVCIYLLVWTLADSSIGVGVVFDTSTDTAFRQCSFSSSAVLVIVAFEALVLLWLLYVVWSTRHITTMFGESQRYYAVVGMVSILCLAAAIVYAVSRSDRVTGQYSVAGGVMLISALALLLFLYIPVCIKMFRKSWMGDGHHLFLSYAKGDKQFTTRLARALTEQGLRVYVDEIRLDAGAAWRKEVAQRLRASQYVLFLVSSESVQSRYCQEEVQFAYDNQIQIIPLILQESFHQTIDSGLDMLIKRFQWTSFTDTTQFDENVRLLLKGLERMELMQRQQRVNDGVKEMHGGVEMSFAPSLCQSAAPSNGSVLPPNYLSESLKPKQVFLSWAHKDASFVKEQLWPQLEEVSIDCWIDCIGLSSGASWRREIGQAIAGCRLLLFVLSPRSANSQYCAEEVHYARSQGKQIVVVVFEESTRVLASFHSDLATVLSMCPVIDFSQNPDAFFANFERLETLIKRALPHADGTEEEQRRLLTPTDGDVFQWPVSQINPGSSAYAMHQILPQTLDSAVDVRSYSSHMSHDQLELEPVFPVLETAL